MNVRFIRILVIFGISLLAGVFIFAQGNQPASTLVVTNYSGGEIDWVSIQQDNSPENKLADNGGSNIVYDNRTVSIPLVNVNTGGRFSGSGNFVVVLKHKDSPRWMYIKSGVQFTNGGASVRWGLWFPWRDSGN